MGAGADRPRSHRDHGPQLKLLGGSRYVVMFIYSASRLQRPYSVSDKSAPDILAVVKRFVGNMERSHVFRANKSSEYTNRIFVDGAAAPKSSLSPLEMRSPPAASGLPAGKASTTTRITFYQAHLWFGPTEETNSDRTSNQYALYYNRSFWLSQLPAPFLRRVVQTESRQNLEFDPGRSQRRLRAYPFLGTWRTLLCGNVFFLKRLVAICGVFLEEQ